MTRSLDRAGGALRFAWAFASAWAVLAAPRLAAACAVCSPGQNDPAQSGLLWGTLLLSGLPLLTIGAGVFFLWRRARSLEASEAGISSPDAAQPTPARAVRAAAR